ncbi:MAG: hypothetical protein IPK11_15810 [Ignavibacteria bacterium]|nr:hypothetical protein [Ignavibacteria bacterium]
MQFDVNGTGVRVTNIDQGLVETEFSLVRFGAMNKEPLLSIKDIRHLSASDVAETIVFALLDPRMRYS